MKKLKVNTEAYRDFESHFGQWLELMSMNSQCCYNMPLNLREMFHYMENRGITSIENITPSELRNYIRYLKLRKNLRRGGALSNGSINKHLQAIKKFSHYLWMAYKIQLVVTIRMQVVNKPKIEILSPEEVASLYDAAEIDHSLTLRDKAILDLCYSCGLRRTEAVMVDVEDIDLVSRRIHVRYGKNHSQRYVPFTQTVARRLKSYMDYSRAELLGDSENPAFIVSHNKKRMQGASMYIRIKIFQKLSSVVSIKQKIIGLHTLRHSIATHLLANGLPLKQVAAFLGHQSIESTQIYTHLAHEL